MQDLNSIKMSGSNTPVSLFIKSQHPQDKEIVTKAVYECLRRNWPLNLTGIGHLVREMRKNASVL